MTYNFDPDRWYEIQQKALDRQRADREISEEEYRARQRELVEEYERMLERLDIHHDY